MTGFRWNMGDSIKEGQIDVTRLNELIKSDLGGEKYYSPGYNIATISSSFNIMTAHLSSSSPRFVHDLVFKVSMLALSNSLGVAVEANVVSGSLPTGGATQLTPISRQSNAPEAQAVIRYCVSSHNGSILGVTASVSSSYWSSLCDSVSVQVSDNRQTSVFSYPKTLFPGESVVVRIISASLNNNMLVSAEWTELDLALTASLFQ